METLEQARKSRGIKQKAVADAIGVSRQTYATYERYPRTMRIEAARAACDFIGCDISEIFFGDNVKFKLT